MKNDKIKTAFVRGFVKKAISAGVAADKAMNILQGVNPALVGAVAGGLGGAGLGYLSGSDEDENGENTRARNAIVGALVGGGAGGLAGHQMNTISDLTGRNELNLKEIAGLTGGLKNKEEIISGLTDQNAKLLKELDVNKDLLEQAFSENSKLLSDLDLSNTQISELKGNADRLSDLNNTYNMVQDLNQYMTPEMYENLSKMDADVKKQLAQFQSALDTAKGVGANVEITPKQLETIRRNMTLTPEFKAVSESLSPLAVNILKNRGVKPTTEATESLVLNELIPFYQKNPTALNTPLEQIDKSLGLDNIADKVYDMFK